MYMYQQFKLSISLLYQQLDGALVDVSSQANGEYTVSEALDIIGTYVFLSICCFSKADCCEHNNHCQLLLF